MKIKASKWHNGMPSIFGVCMKWRRSGVRRAARINIRASRRTRVWLAVSAARQRNILMAAASPSASAWRKWRKIKSRDCRLFMKAWQLMAQKAAA